MTRKELLIEEIQKELVKMELEELDICSNDENQMDKSFPYNNICSLIWNVSSDICIEKVETESDSRYQVTAFINVSPIKWYTVVLDSSFENTLIECIWDLADTIIQYEDEAKTLVLKKTIEIERSEAANKINELILEHFEILLITCWSCWTINSLLDWQDNTTCVTCWDILQSDEHPDLFY